MCEEHRPGPLAPEDFSNIPQGEKNTERLELSISQTPHGPADGPLGALGESVASVVVGTKLALTLEVPKLDLAGIPINASGKLEIGDGEDAKHLKKLGHLPARKQREPKYASKGRGKERFRI